MRPTMRQRLPATIASRAGLASVALGGAQNAVGVAGGDDRDAASARLAVQVAP